jgi:hypothetical protein
LLPDIQAIARARDLLAQGGFTPEQLDQFAATLAILTVGEAPQNPIQRARNLRAARNRRYRETHRDQINAAKRDKRAPSRASSRGSDTVSPEDAAKTRIKQNQQVDSVYRASSRPSSPPPAPTEYREAFERFKREGPRAWGPRYGPFPDKEGYRGPACIRQEFQEFKARQMVELRARAAADRG